MGEMEILGLHQPAIPWVSPPLELPPWKCSPGGSGLSSFAPLIPLDAPNLWKISLLKQGGCYKYMLYYWLCVNIKMNAMCVML